jgi:pyruvate dehydrogenase E2 component (dihydrolipoamide acetyltransferase)
MANVVVMPIAGQTMEYGTVVEWLKKEGEPVQKGEPLVTIMSDKANLEIESDFSGVLKKILVRPEDGEVDCLTPIAVIGTADEVIDLPTLLRDYE